MYRILTDYYNKYILSLSRNFLIIMPKFCSSMVLWLHSFQYSVCSHLVLFQRNELWETIITKNKGRRQNSSNRDQTFEAWIF